MAYKSIYNLYFVHLLTRKGLLAQQVANALEELLRGTVVCDLALVCRRGDDGETVDGIEVVLISAAIHV